MVEKNVGRPKKDIKRENRSLKAFDDEWDLIRRFSKLLKYHDLDACREFVENQERIAEKSKN